MKTFRITLTVCLMIISLALSAKTIRYVKVDANGDGTSWVNASGNIQTMIDNSVEGDEVWVAKGTYYPTTETTAREATSRTFISKSGVNFYGGFAGTETALSQRALADLDANGKVDSFELVNQTILSGEIDGIADVWTKTVYSDSTWIWSVAGQSGNCLYVVSIGKDCIMDGFCVKGSTYCGIGTRFTESYSTRIINCTVVDCVGTGISTSSALIRHCLVSRCTLGGILATRFINNEAVVSNATVMNCSGGDGAGINTYYSNNYIENCVVINCSASRNGGGINANAKGCIVKNCIAGSEGGGIYCFSGSVENCFVTNCKAPNGGGIKSQGIVKRCTVSNCEAKINGGGIWGNSVSDCSISQCKSTMDGGGIWAAQTDTSNVGNCTLNNCSTPQSGGGVYAKTADKCTVIDCSAGVNGGGIYVSGNNAARYCAVKNCSAGVSGGGICTSTYEFDINIGVSNCFVSNCDATTLGGGISANSAVNCTVTNCTAQNAGGISVVSRYVPTINCVVANCFSSVSNGGVSARVLNNCALSNNSTNGTIGAEVSTGSIVSYISPNIATSYIHPTSFIGAATSNAQKEELIIADWHLTKVSPCVNTGANSDFTRVVNSGFDIDGNTRVVGGIVDIGVYEYQFLDIGISLPSFENFDQLTNWDGGQLFMPSAIQTKWQIANQKALFDWHTNLTSAYSESFVTYSMDAINLSSVFLRYDMYFEAYVGSISPLGTEKLNVEFSTDMTNWTSITAYSNANGTIANKTYKHDISNMAAGKKFFIRFNANGENSNRIEKWEVDNVIVDKDGLSGITPIFERKMSFTITNGTLKINNLEANSAVELYDVEGQLVSSILSAASVHTVSLPHRGVYLVKVKKGKFGSDEEISLVIRKIVY